MLQSRLGAVVGIGARRRAGAIWELGKRGLCQEGGDSSPSQGGATAQGTTPLPTGRSGDTAVHSSELLGDDAEAAALSTTASERTSTDETEQPLVPPKAPTSSSPKLEHTEVGRSSSPNTYQKRQFSNTAAQAQSQSTPVHITCAGLEESPWPDDAEGQKAQKKAQEEDNKEYFKDHKASPLSEVEFADTRKPVSQATSHETGAGPTLSYFGGEVGVSVWRPEQMESAEETMLKTAKLWNWNKMRGDPESPHGRVLRALRGENSVILP